MKPIVFTVVLAFAVPAWAQDKPAPKEPAKPAAAKKEKAASSKRSEDARHCLEKASNTEVIKCAEAYL